MSCHPYQLLPPATKLRQGNVFYICQSVSQTPPSPWADTPGQAPGPQADTPLPRGRHPLGQTSPLDRHPHGQTSPRQTPPTQCMLGYKPPAHCMLGYTPSPGQCMMEYCQKAGGTHPTGMHSCLLNSIHSTNYL